MRIVSVIDPARGRAVCFGTSREVELLGDGVEGV